MKVICVNNKGCIDNRNGTMRNAPMLEEGKIYTVIESITHPLYNTHGYILLEVKADDAYKGAFNSDRFIPLSSIDELELLEQRQTELV